MRAIFPVFPPSLPPTAGYLDGQAPGLYWKSTHLAYGRPGRVSPQGQDSIFVW